MPRPCNTSTINGPAPATSVRTDSTNDTLTITVDTDLTGRTFTLTLGGADHDALPVIAGHKTVTITYSAAVNGNARRDMSIDNTATTAYSDNPADWTHTGAIISVSAAETPYACRKEIAPTAEAMGVIASSQLLSFHCYYFNSRRYGERRCTPQT